MFLNSFVRSRLSYRCHAWHQNPLGTSKFSAVYSRFLRSMTENAIQRMRLLKNVTRIFSLMLGFCSSLWCWAKLLLVQIILCSVSLYPILNVSFLCFYDGFQFQIIVCFFYLYFGMIYVHTQKAMQYFSTEYFTAIFRFILILL